jgi:hypothetical protein
VKVRKLSCSTASPGWHDEAELVPVVPAPRDEGAAVRLVRKGGVGAALLAFACHPVPFEMAQMSIGRLACRAPHL